MNHPNLDIIDKFFDAYGRRDVKAVAQVMAPDVQWTSRGRHPLAGVRKGISEVIAFFDVMGSIMGASHVKVEKLVIGANDEYVVESQRIRTDRADGVNLDHRECVLWRFSGGKIAEGTHFFADPEAVDAFFAKVAAHPK